MRAPKEGSEPLAGFTPRSVTGEITQQRGELRARHLHRSRGPDHLKLPDQSEFKHVQAYHSGRPLFTCCHARFTAVSWAMAPPEYAPVVRSGLRDGSADRDRFPLMSERSKAMHWMIDGAYGEHYRRTMGYPV